MVVNYLSYGSFESLITIVYILENADFGLFESSCV
jgi:hypothetical protein